MNHIKSIALLGISMLGGAVDPLVNASSGLECMENKACTPGLPVMGDEPASKSPEPLMINLAIASGVTPSIHFEPAPGWSVVDEREHPVVFLPVTLPPGRFSQS
jgi:hypothetical protein